MPAPAALSFLGIAKEATKGTGVAATAFIPVSSVTPQDNQQYLDDSGMRGSMVDSYGKIAGVLWAGFDFGGPVFADTIGFPIAGVLGDYAQSASGPTVHTMSLKNSGDGQPTAYSLTDFYGLTQARQFTGMQFSEVGLKFSADGLLEYTAKSVGFASALVTKPTASWTAVTATPAWECVTTIGGSTVTYLESAEFNIKRKGGLIHTADNSAAPYKIFMGTAVVSGKLVMVIEDDTEYIRYLTNTQPSLDLTWSHGATTTQAGITLHTTKAAYTNAKIVRGKDYAEVEVDFECVPNSTDVGASGGFSPCKVTVKNQIASSAFA